MRYKMEDDNNNGDCNNNYLIHLVRITLENDQFLIRNPDEVMRKNGTVLLRFSTKRLLFVDYGRRSICIRGSNRVDDASVVRDGNNKPIYNYGFVGVRIWIAKCPVRICCWEYPR